MVSPIFLNGSDKSIASLHLENLSTTLFKENLISPSEFSLLLAELQTYENSPDTLITFPGIYQAWGYKF